MNFPVHVDTGQQGREERRAHSCRTAAPAAPFMAPAHDAKSINAKEAHVEATMATNCSRARPHRPFGTTLLESWAKILACTQLNFLELLIAVSRKPGDRRERESEREIFIYIYI